MKTFHFAFVATSLYLLAASQSTHAELAGVFPAQGGKITVAPTAGPIRAGGIQFVPMQGTLTQGATAVPFQIFIPDDNAPGNVTFGALGTPVLIDGPVTLDVDASADAVIDASWGKGAVPTAFPVVGGGLLPDGSEAPTGPITGGGDGGGGDGNVGGGHDGPIDPRLVGTFPTAGGKLTVTPTAGPIQAGGIELIPTRGTLTQGTNPAPFAFFIPNSAQPGIVTFGALGRPVLIDGPVTLDVTISADAIVSGAWGDGVMPTKFAINGGGDPVDPGNGGGGISPADAHAGPVDPRLVGTFPSAGGKLTVAPTAGPVQSNGFELMPISGTLTKGTSPAPFQFFIPNSKMRGNVTWASVETSVTIDGPITLDVNISADAIISGIWGDGETPVKFAINGNGDPVDPGAGGGGGGTDVTNNPPLNQPSIDLALEDLGPAAVESQLLVLFPEGGGPLTIMGTNGPVETLGIEFVAEPGMLVQGDSAEPFSFFIENTEATGNVTLGSLGVPVLIDEPITLDIIASADAVLSGQWGEGNLATFPAFAVPNVPEPSGHWLAMIGALGLLSLRQVRKN